MLISLFSVNKSILCLGQLKISLGSGSFLDVNTGKDVHASMQGLVPLVGWRIGDDLVYLAEGAYHDTSSVIIWAQNMGLFENPSDSSAIGNTNVTFIFIFEKNALSCVWFLFFQPKKLKT